MVNWKKIPLENMMLKEMSIGGHGKRCELTIKTKDPEKKVTIGMIHPTLNIHIQGKMMTKFFSYDDLDVGIKYTPSEEIKIAKVEIDFSGDDDEWVNSINEFKNGASNFINWEIRDINIVFNDCE